MNNGNTISFRIVGYIFTRLLANKDLTSKDNITTAVTITLNYTSTRMNLNNFVHNQLLE